uniref:Variant surface glycoprotein 1125.2587 n=1 Tax=Trypanosoma brucei TaxID=5691 RepID=A0A1J0R8L3_9TRYP|nr:variant surface glycoprotein 1125.2587 [Trypanosoma brucei]
MFIIRGALITTVLDTIICKGVASTPGLDDITKPCHEAQYLEKAAQDLEGNLMSATSTLKQLTADYMALMLITTCPETPADATKAALVAGETMKAAGRLQGDINSKKGTIKQVTKFLMQRAAQIRFMEGLAAEKLETTGTAAAGCDSSGTWLGNNNEHTCTIQVEQTMPTVPTCVDSKEGNKFLTAVPQELLQQQKTKLLTDDFFKMPKTSSVIYAIGNFAGVQLGTPATQWCASDANGEGRITLGVGLKQATQGELIKTANVEQLKNIAQDGNTCKKLSSTATAPITTKEKTAQVLCSSLAATITLPARPLTTAEATLAQNRELQKLVQLINDGQIDTTKLATSAEEQAGKLLASAAEAPQKKILAKLAGTEITYKQDKTDNKVAVNKDRRNQLEKYIRFVFRQPAKSVNRGKQWSSLIERAHKTRNKGQTRIKER